MQQELRFDPVYVGRVQQGFKQMPQQRCLDISCRLQHASRRLVWILPRQSEHVADHGLRLFVHAKNVARHLSRFQRRKARKKIAVKVSQKNARRSKLIQMEPIAPKITYSVQPGTKLRRTEWPKNEVIGKPASRFLSLVEYGRRPP